MIQIDQRRLPSPPVKLPPVTRHDPFGRAGQGPPRPRTELPQGDVSHLAPGKGAPSRLGLPEPVIRWPAGGDFE